MWNPCDLFNSKQSLAVNLQHAVDVNAQLSKYVMDMQNFHATLEAQCWVTEDGDVRVGPEISIGLTTGSARYTTTQINQALSSFNSFGFGLGLSGRARVANIFDSVHIHLKPSVSAQLGLLNTPPNVLNADGTNSGRVGLFNPDTGISEGAEGGFRAGLQAQGLVEVGLPLGYGREMGMQMGLQLSRVYLFPDVGAGYAFTALNFVGGGFVIF